jgi:hypothetical protein
MDRRPAISRKISRPAEMGIGRRSSVDRRRPAVPRKLAKPAEMGFSGRSSLHRRRPTIPKKDCKTCRDGQRQEIFCG